MNKEELEEYTEILEIIKKEELEKSFNNPDYIHVHGKGYDPDES